MTERANTCANCKWFQLSEDRYHIGGYCNWRAPMKLRGLLWGAHNERIGKPDQEWCNQHSGEYAELAGSNK